MGKFMNLASELIASIINKVLKLLNVMPCEGYSLRMCIQYPVSRIRNNSSQLLSRKKMYIRPNFFGNPLKNKGHTC
jgi:uncharacterized protein YvpB